VVCGLIQPFLDLFIMQAATMPDNLVLAKRHLQQALRMLVSPSCQQNSTENKEVWIRMANDRVQQARRAIGFDKKNKTNIDTLLSWFEPQEQQMLKTGQASVAVHASLPSLFSRTTTTPPDPTKASSPVASDGEQLRDQLYQLQQKFDSLQQEHSMCPMKEYVVQCEQKIETLYQKHSQDQQTIQKQEEQLNKFTKTLAWTQKELDASNKQLMSFRKHAQQDRRTTLAAQLTEAEVDGLAAMSKSQSQSQSTLHVLSPSKSINIELLESRK